MSGPDDARDPTGPVARIERRIRRRAGEIDQAADYAAALGPELGDDGALHAFWILAPTDIEALAPLAGDPDPGAGGAVIER